MSQEPTQKPLPGIAADDLPAGDPRHLVEVCRGIRPAEPGNESDEDRRDRDVNASLRRECMRRWIRPEIRRRKFQSVNEGLRAVRLEAEGETFERAYQILFPATGGKVTVRLGPDVDLALETGSYALHDFDGGHVTILEREDGTILQAFDFTKNHPARGKRTVIPQAIKKGKRK